MKKLVALGLILSAPALCWAVHLVVTSYWQALTSDIGFTLFMTSSITGILILLWCLLDNLSRASTRPNG